MKNVKYLLELSTRAPDFQFLVDKYPMLNRALYSIYVETGRLVLDNVPFDTYLEMGDHVIYIAYFPGKPLPLLMDSYHKIRSGCHD